jgi:hypothetical protein
MLYLVSRKWCREQDGRSRGCTKFYIQLLWPLKYSPNIDTHFTYSPSSCYAWLKKVNILDNIHVKPAISIRKNASTEDIGNLKHFNCNAYFINWPPPLSVIGFPGIYVMTYIAISIIVLI